MIKILHTSDLHLGKELYKRRRYDEFERFLTWLLEQIKKEEIDCLIIAGDIFDTTTPSNRATELYYDFLAKIAKTCCRHIVITAGNHDSPALLNAPGRVLKALDIHVVSLAKNLELLAENPQDEVLSLYDANGNLELLVCAVPFLQDANVRKSKPGETFEEKVQNRRDGIQSHYQIVCEHAREIQIQEYKERNSMVPIVATGHIYATSSGFDAKSDSGKANEAEDGEGVRPLYIGTLGKVSATIFPPYLDYVALGHIHIPRKVGTSETVRYSGSPLAIGFGEATQQKSVVMVQIDMVSIENCNNTIVDLIPVPTFQRMIQLKGDWEKIKADIRTLKKEPLEDGETIWLEIDHEGEFVPNLNGEIEKAIQDSKLEVLYKTDRSMKMNSAIERFFMDSDHFHQMTLDDTTVEETFQQLMNSQNVSPERQTQLMETFNEILHGLEIDS